MILSNQPIEHSKEIMKTSHVVKMVLLLVVVFGALPTSLGEVKTWPEAFKTSIASIKEEYKRECIKNICSVLSHFVNFHYVLQEHTRTPFNWRSFLKTIGRHALIEEAQCIQQGYKNWEAIGGDALLGSHCPFAATFVNGYLFDEDEF